VLAASRWLRHCTTGYPFSALAIHTHFRYF
jgi:hypothetical protein